MLHKEQSGVPVFGSAYRSGREDAGYQASRLRMLWDFTTRLLDAYSRQLRAQRRRARELWDAKNWLADQNQRLEASLAEASQVAAERGNWIAKLEGGKDYLERTLKEHVERVKTLERANSELESALRRHAAAVAGLEAQSNELATRAVTLQHELEHKEAELERLSALAERRRRGWWGRWRARTNS